MKNFQKYTSKHLEFTPSIQLGGCKPSRAELEPLKFSFQVTLEFEDGRRDELTSSQLGSNKISIKFKKNLNLTLTPLKSYFYTLNIEGNS